MEIIPRHLGAKVEEALATSRIVNVVGPRQAGKTTLVRDLLEHERYLTLDDRGVHAAFEQDPQGQIELLAEQRAESDLPIVIDEVQRVPEVALALKAAVDRNTDPGQYILTGSSNIFTTGRALDSLAGRVMTLTLRPLSTAEVARQSPCRLLDALDREPARRLHALPVPEDYRRSEVISLIVRGGFPEIRTLSGRNRIDRYNSYLDSIIERDVADVTEIRKPTALRRLIDQAAARTAQEITVSSLSQHLGVSQPTIQKYLDVLSHLGIIHRLDAWTSSRAKRGIKSPKLHFLDTGCATALRGEDTSSFGPGADPTALGHLLETFVFVEVEKSLPYLNSTWRLYHWRDQRGREVDIVAEAPDRRLALIEVKAASTVDAGDFEHIEWFMQDGPGRSYTTAGVVLYLGDEIVSFGEDQLALPLSVLWSYGE
ncbi:MAG: ATP-binding protein [Candidatus Palauibacterales bacterium]|nr:ATP-binding protein [Candidatus Palauibacterales bacterium]